MNEFALCIEYILLCHDHITIPGLGTFIAQPHDSVYDEQEGTLLPPRRQVRFCADLKQEDLSFYSAVQQIYGLTLEEADRKVASWTADFFQTISDDGCLEFGSIGTFTNEDSKMAFTPTQAGITTPEYYALDTLQIRRIEERKPASSPIIKSDAKNITIRLNKAIATNLAAACLAIILFFSFSIKVGNTEPMSFGQVDVSSLFFPSNLTPSFEDKASPSPSTGTTGVVTETTPSATLTAASSVDSGNEGKFCIVLASDVSRKNAVTYVETLQSRGLDTARIIEGKILRVAVGSYDTESEAHAAARQLRRSSEEYESAWVFENKSDVRE